MSTKARHGPFREDDGLNKPLFRRPAPDLRRMVWRDLQPLLMRSAGVVGLAGVIVAVIASAPLADKPADSGQEALQVTLREPAEPPPPSDSVEAQAAAEQRLAAFTALRHAEAGAPPPELVQAALTVQKRAAGSPGAAGKRPAAQAPAPAASPELDSPAVEPAPQPGTAAAPDTTTARDAVRAALAPPASSAAEVAAEKASLWAEDATNCPRDWLALRSSGASEAAPADCSGMAVPPAPMVDVAPAPGVADPGELLLPAAESAEPGGFSSAALNLAPEALPADGLTSEFVAPFPRVRPEPPAGAVKRPPRAKTASRGKLGPPPNCGKKYARWRYVNKQPTWYCK